jgi:hypothetical protein
VYRLTQSETTVHRLTDNAFIPFDGGNRDYQEYLEWLAEGNVPEPLPVDVAAEKKAYQEKIDTDAETARLQFITPGSGMALTYQEKFAQAQAVADMGEVAANALSAQDREAQFPTLSASVGIEAGTLYDCAQLVLAKYAAFAQMSLAIERARLSGKAAIAAASDTAAARAAYEAITWPTP